MKRYPWFIEDGIADARQECAMLGIPSSGKVEARFMANNARRAFGRTNRRTYHRLDDTNTPEATVTKRPEGAPTWLYAILTDHEYTAARMLANGCNWRQIADALGVSHQWANKIKPRLAARLDYHREALSC